MFGALMGGQGLGLLANIVAQLHQFKMAEDARKQNLANVEGQRLDLERLRGYSVPFLNQLGGQNVQDRARMTNEYATNYQNMLVGNAAPRMQRTPLDPRGYMPPNDPTLGRAGLAQHLRDVRPELMTPAFNGDEAFDMRMKLLSAMPKAPALKGKEKK